MSFQEDRCVKNSFRKIPLIAQNVIPQYILRLLIDVCVWDNDLVRNLLSP